MYYPEEASVCSFRAIRRQSICWETAQQVSRVMLKLRSWKGCSSLRLGKQLCMFIVDQFYMIALLGRCTWKGNCQWHWWRLHIYYSGLLGDIALRVGVLALWWLIFNTFYFWEGVVVLKEVIFLQLPILESMVVLKGLNFNNFYFGRVW